MQSLTTPSCMGKNEQLQIMGSRIVHLCTHDAYCLLSCAIAIPKLLYLLRTSPCFLSCCQGSLSLILTPPTFVLTMTASLPVHTGGPGIRSAAMLVPSAFWASTAGTSDLINQILRTPMRDLHALFPHPGYSVIKETGPRGRPTHSHSQFHPEGMG